MANKKNFFYFYKFLITFIVLILLKNILISQDLKKLIYMNEYIIVDTTIYNDLYDIILPE
jgi:hypothetical protein